MFASCHCSPAYGARSLLRPISHAADPDAFSSNRRRTVGGKPNLARGSAGRAGLFAPVAWVKPLILAPGAPGTPVGGKKAPPAVGSVAHQWILMLQALLASIVLCLVALAVTQLAPRGWADATSMRAHIDSHLAGTLQGEVPSEWLRSQRRQRCSVRGLQRFLPPWHPPPRAALLLGPLLPLKPLAQTPLMTCPHLQPFRRAASALCAISLPLLARFGARALSHMPWPASPHYNDERGLARVLDAPPVCPVLTRLGVAASTTKPLLPTPRIAYSVGWRATATGCGEDRHRPTRRYASHSGPLSRSVSWPPL